MNKFKEWLPIIGLFFLEEGTNSFIKYLIYILYQTSMFGLLLFLSK